MPVLAAAHTHQLSPVLMEDTHPGGVSETLGEVLNAWDARSYLGGRSFETLDHFFLNFFSFLSGFASH